MKCAGKDLELMNQLQLQQSNSHYLKRLCVRSLASPQMSNQIFRTHDERETYKELDLQKLDLEQTVDNFISCLVPGPKQRRLAKNIIEMTRQIIKKEEELARIRKMSKEYTRRKS